MERRTGAHRSRRRIVGALTLFALAAAQIVQAPAANAAAGDLDPTFGTGGKVTTDLARGNRGVIWFSEAGAIGRFVVRKDGTFVVPEQTAGAPPAVRA